MRNRALLPGTGRAVSKIVKRQFCRDTLSGFPPFLFPGPHGDSIYIQVSALIGVAVMLLY
jgi:hypothetical protein